MYGNGAWHGTGSLGNCQFTAMLLLKLVCTETDFSSFNSGSWETSILRNLPLEAMDPTLGAVRLVVGLPPLLSENFCNSWFCSTERILNKILTDVRKKSMMFFLTTKSSGETWVCHFMCSLIFVTIVIIISIIIFFFYPFAFADDTLTISCRVHGKKVGNGCHLTAWGWALLPGRSFCFNSCWPLSSYILTRFFGSIYISKRSKIEKHCLSVCGLRTSSREALGFLGFRICTQHDFLDLPLTCKHKITTGFFTENSVVVAEGDFQANGVFQVLLVLELQCIFSTYRFSISVQAPHCYAWSIPRILC